MEVLKIKILIRPKIKITLAMVKNPERIPSGGASVLDGLN